MKKCIVSRDDEGNVTSVSAALPPEQIKEQKELFSETGKDEDNLQVVSKEVGRRMKRNLV